MEHAATAAMPAYTPVDAHDLHAALTQVDQRLAKLYPDRIGSKALLGYSMGAFHALFIAATAATNQEPLVKFDRFVAINTPVRCCMVFPSWMIFTSPHWRGPPQNEPPTLTIRF